MFPVHCQWRGAQWALPDQERSHPMSEHTHPTPEHAESRVPLPGSERPTAARIQNTLGPANPAHRIEVTVILRRQEPLPETATEPTQPAQPLTREELAARHGASDADLSLATETFTRLGADVVEADPASRRIRLAGTVEVLSRIFGTSLEEVTSSGSHGHDVTHRHRTGGLKIPAELDGIVTAVLGLDDRPQARAQF